jgi:hypothetical protein
MRTHTYGDAVFGFDDCNARIVDSSAALMRNEHVYTMNGDVVHGSDVSITGVVNLTSALVCNEHA